MAIRSFLLSWLVRQRLPCPPAWSPKAFFPCTHAASCSRPRAHKTPHTYNVSCHDERTNESFQGGSRSRKYLKKCLAGENPCLLSIQTDQTERSTQSPTLQFQLVVEILIICITLVVALSPLDNGLSSLVTTSIYERSKLCVSKGYPIIVRCIHPC